MRVSRIVLLTPSLALVLAAAAVAGAAQACGTGGASDHNGSSGERHHHGHNHSAPDSYIYREGMPYGENGKPYNDPERDRGRYLQDLRRYNDQPWYRRMLQERPTPESRHDYGDPTGGPG